MIYFLVYLFIEIFVTYEFTHMVSPFGTFLEILISGFLGVFILRTLQFSLVDSMQRVARREISQEEFMSIGLFKLIGAFLLILPGVFSDILGILMQFDEFGAFVARRFLPKREKQDQNPFDKDDDIIDVEIIEDKK
jgi:UPF0716 family protein affecting phage T7 exclusion